MRDPVVYRAIPPPLYIYIRHRCELLQTLGSRCSWDARFQMTHSSECPEQLCLGGADTAEGRDATSDVAKPLRSAVSAGLQPCSVAWCGCMKSIAESRKSALYCTLWSNSAVVLYLGISESHRFSSCHKHAIHWTYSHTIHT